MKNFDLIGNLGTDIIWLARIQCPSLSVAREVYTALLVEAARPESLPKFTLNYGRETPVPEPRPLPDSTGRLEPASDQDQIVAVHVHAQPPADWVYFLC